MGSSSRIVEARVHGRYERGNAGVPTSSGNISEKTRRARREGGTEIRNTLFNDAAQRHHELSNNPFGSRCSCKTTHVQTKIESPGSSSHGPGESGGAASDSGGRTGGAMPGPHMQAEKLPSFGPIQVASVGGGGSAEPPFTFVGSSNALEAPLERSSPAVSGSVVPSNGSSTGGSMQQPADHMPLGESNETVGPKSDGAASISTNASTGCLSAAGLASRVIDNMPAPVQAEFASAAFEGSVVSNAQFEKIKLTLKEIKPSSPSTGRRRPARTRGSAQSLYIGWRRKAAKAGKSKTAARPETTDTRPENKSLILSEENKEHLKIITAALISDLLPEMLALAANDPRIQKFNLGSSKRLKERIIKEYKAELRAKRKSEVSLLITAMRLSKNAVSSKAYATVRGILVQMGHREVLPTVKDVRKAGEHLMKCATEDLKIHSTPDGWFVSPRALLEMEILRSLQMTSVRNASRLESGARLIGHSGPGMHGWQDDYQVKFTLDARSITKRTSHTEVMMQVFKKGKQGQAESQKSLCMRTVGIFMGKDSRENVQANMTGFNKECQDLAEHGIIFNMVGQTFLGQSEAFRNLGPEARLAEESADSDPAEKVFHAVKIGFWVPADMAAQCALIGHGCGGHHYCAHCNAHEEERHLPYKLITVDEDISLQALAKKHDMHVRTLYAINAGKDHKGIQNLTREGLRNSTAMDPEAREQARQQAREAEPEQAGGRRPGKKAKLVPVAKEEPDSLMLGGTLPIHHSLNCSCEECRIPKGTCVRVIPRVGFCRPSEYLSEHFPFLSAERMPFCALHCLMRVTEGMFYQICQAVLTSKERPKLVARMNAALKAEKINRQFQQNMQTEKWEKVSFEGHQAKALLTVGPDGKMAIERILYAIWPAAAEDTDVGKKYGKQFVPRTLEVWKQWAVVEDLMSERFSDVLHKNVVGGLDGFERFGMECREFIFRFQAMSTEDYSKSYYLHTLLHHAGDFMRALQKEGMTLGMMSNSGAERRHEYGRRASRKALASNGWRKKCPEYDKMQNLLVYITLKEIMTWDYGEDLITHELARLSKEGELPSSGPLQKGGCNVVFKTKSRRALLSEEEASEEHEAGPLDPPPDFETRNKAVWGFRGKNKTHAIFEVEPDTGSEDGADVEADKLEGHKYNPDNETGLFSGVPVYASDDDDESDAGSEEDFEFETINDGEFPDEVDENDKEFQAAGKGGTMAVRGVRGGYPFRETTVNATRASLAAAAAAEAQSGGGFTCLGPENAIATEEAMAVGAAQGPLAPAAVSRGEFSEPAGARRSPSPAAATRVGGGGTDEAQGGRRRVVPRRRSRSKRSQK